MTSRLEQVQCPACGTVLDAATGLTGKEGPEPGDLTVCLYCSAVLMFEEPPQLRVLSTIELAALLDPRQLEMLSRVVSAVTDYQETQRE
jgi:hypothetical protein